jgi:hypothetical protein
MPAGPIPYQRHNRGWGLSTFGDGYLTPNEKALADTGERHYVAACVGYNRRRCGQPNSRVGRPIAGASRDTGEVVDVFLSNWKDLET